VKSPFFSPHTTRPPAFHSTAIERLEARIAPAVLVNAKTLTFTDIDGDLVTLTISKGTLTAADFAFDGAFDSNGFQQLQLLNFAGDKDKAGADISITAVAGGAGNGSVNVGYLNATGIDLGKVTIDGDLGRIDAGDAILTTPGTKRLEVGSMGASDLTTQAAGGNLTSHIIGPLNAFVATGGLETATLLVTGAIGNIDIGGNITGGDTAQSGSIRANGPIGVVHVGLDLRGGSGDESGQIFSARKIGSVVIDGSIVGSSSPDADKNGMVFAGRTIDLAVVGQDIIGGAGVKSGQIASGTGMGAVQVSGSVRGGAGFESGAIGSGGPISSINITHDLIGYQDSSSGGESSGSLLSTSTISRIVIGGDIRGGENLHSGVIGTARSLGNVTVQGSVIGGDGEESGAIGSNGPIGSVKIVGNLEGRDGNQSGRVVSKRSIASVLVQGSVLGGFGSESGAIGALGTVQSVRVEGDLIGSDGNHSGLISSEKKLASVTVVGALGFSSRGKGPAAAAINGNSGGFFGSGLISAPVINRVTVGTIGSAQDFFDPGSIQGGAIGTIAITNSIFSSFFQSARIDARSIGTMTVANDIVGEQTFSSFSSPVEITVRKSLGSLTIGGNANYLSVVAGGGFDPVEGPANPDAQVGRIKVSGNWVESIVAVGTFAGSDGTFGTLDDKIDSGGNPDVLGTIARIQIGGTISNGPSSGNPFGFLAEHITALIVNGEAAPLKAGAFNDSKFLDSESEAAVFVRENNKPLIFD
jgi:hypothetical protein